MKRFNKVILLMSLLAISFGGFAQAPNLLNYQAVARNSAGNPLPNQKMNLRLSIHNFSSTGLVVYSETRAITTNAGGLFAVQIGSAGTTASTGTLSGVNWLDGDKYLQVEIDPDANNNYSNLGNVQLISVPYALSSVSATTAVTANKLSGLNTSVATLNNVSGTNTGDNAVNSLYAGLVSNATHTGDAEGSTALTVKGINGTPLSGLGTGILKNTTGTGVPSIAVAGTDYLSPTGSAAGLTNFPTLNQNTTGNAATATKLAATKNINGVPFDGSTDITISATADAGTLAGTALKSTITGSSLTSVGTLTNLTVTNPIVGSVNGNAATATKLAATKNINGVPFDGSTDIVISASADAGTLTGTTLKSTITNSSLTSVGTLTNLTVTNPIVGSINGNAATASKLAATKNINGIPFDGSADITISASADAGTLTGTTLNSTITGSSLTSVGTLANLTVTNPIAGSINGNASTATKLSAPKNINGIPFDGSTDITISASADAGTLTGTTLNSTITSSGLTSVGTLANLTVTNPIIGSVTGNAATATTAGNITATSNSTLTTLTNLSSVGTISTGTISLTTDIKTSGKIIAGAVTYPSMHGTSGQVLSTIGSGTLTWTTVSGGSAGIPYTGATGAVDLGAYDLKVNGLTIGRGSGNINGNTAAGSEALKNNTTGYDNTANGFQALKNNTTGNRNTANGMSALLSNTTGQVNTAIGYLALTSNTEGSWNTANGIGALQLNTTGGFNTAIGTNSLLNNNGNYNIAMGSASLQGNTSGASNVAIGFNTNSSNTSGNNNTAVGNGSLGTNTTGSNNTALGLGADVAASNLSNATAIGYNASVAASNSIQLGNTSVENVKTSGTITAGTITYPNTHGTSGQVLTTLGSGMLSWTTAQNASDTSSLSNRINAVNLGLNNKLNLTDTSNMFFGYKTAINNKLNIIDTSNMLSRYLRKYDTASLSSRIDSKMSKVDTSFMLSGYLRKYDNATTATLAGNITATTNTTLTSLASLNTVGTITSGTISLTTNISTTGTLKAGTITYPNTAGTSGYYLKTDGTGTATWAAVSSGGAGSGVPYTGATGAVNLGAYDLKVQGLTIGLGNGTTTSNTAFGLNVLKSATTGYDNTAMGKDALYTNTSGTSNVAVGTVALYSNSTGGENSAFGMYSLFNNTGSFNTGIGMHALQTNTTGTHNTAIGVWANVTSGGLTNATAVGYNAQATASNSVRLGDANISSIGGNVGWTAASDLRIKKNITNTNYGLSTVMQLRPVEYNLISNDLKQVGFIAQEVKKLVPEVVTGKEGDLKKGEILGITYANLVPVLTKAIQEQQTIIDNQNKRLSELESLVKKLAATK